MIEPEFDLTSPLNFRFSVYKSTDVPLHTRLRAAAEACKHLTPQLKAVALVAERNMADVLDRARERIRNANVISLVPKALEHDAAELKPDVSRSAGAQSQGFKRRF
jgi:hypothetical protein